VRLDTNPLDPSAQETDEVFHVHLPSPSYYPILMSIGLVTLAYGFLWRPVGYIAMAIGAAIMVWAIFGWAMEDIDHPMGNGDHSDGEHHDDGGHDAEAEPAETQMAEVGASDADEVE